MGPEKLGLSPKRGVSRILASPKAALASNDESWLDATRVS